MKTFREQFCECRKSGLNLKTRFLKWKNHPQMNPMFRWSKAGQIVEKELMENPDAGFELNVCGKFGGICGSHNKKCKELRNNGTIV